MKSTTLFVAVLTIASLSLTLPNLADAKPVASITGGSGGTPVGGSAHGWQFIANDSIVVTHLGLYDEGSDGLVLDHLIGLFRLSDASLLTSGTVLQGSSNMLIDSFRYMDTPDVQLSAGEDYVIAAYSDQFNGDFMIVQPTGLSVDPSITITDGRWGIQSFGIPENADQSRRFGPNFLFQIPEPTAIGLSCLALIGLGICRWRK